MGQMDHQDQGIRITEAQWFFLIGCAQYVAVLILQGHLAFRQKDGISKKAIETTKHIKFDGVLGSENTLEHLVIGKKNGAPKKHDKYKRVKEVTATPCISIFQGCDADTNMVRRKRNKTEEALVSRNSLQHIIWAKHNEIQTVNIKSVGADYEVADGGRLPLAVKELGTCDLYPQVRFAS